MPTVWDLYLDAADAEVLLRAVTTLERHRAVREPLPLHDAAALVERLGLIARVAEEDVVHWGREAEDRREEAEVDGGRWGRPEIARTMVDTALGLVDSSRRIAEVARAAATDLAARLEGAGYLRRPGGGASVASQPGSLPGIEEAGPGRQ